MLIIWVQSLSQNIFITSGLLIREAFYMVSCSIRGVVFMGRVAVR